MLVCVVVVLGLSACKKEQGCTDPLATNYDENAEEDDNSCVYELSYPIPSTYSFTDTAGNNTVSFNGQAQRLEMLSEMTSLMKSANTSGTAVDAADLHAMYANEGFSWNDAEGLGMTGSSKNLKSKTAAPNGTPDPAIQQHFEDLMAALESASANTVAGDPQGGPGVAGVVVSTTNNSKMYLQSAQGMEYTQLIEKGLMGAVFLNQISAVYLGSDKMNVDNTTAVEPANGKYYTEMEHHWDEAFGYFTTATDYPASGTDRFWGKYATSRNEVMDGIADNIFQAFLNGRAAIVNNDMETRDAQIAIIRTELERVAAGTAIHYLNAANSTFADDALRNHSLSEAIAFMDAVAYSHEPRLSFSEVNALKSELGDDFYAVTAMNILSVRDQVAAAFNLDSIKDQL